MATEPSDERTVGINEIYDSMATEKVEGDLRRWHLYRVNDHTGVSGTGIVASGVMFHDGSVAYKWRSEPSTLQYAEKIDTVVEIHGHGGKTKVVWEDKPQ